jgi:hypothetical protein
MADTEKEFDTRGAKQKQGALIESVRDIRRLIDKEVISYYDTRPPRSERDEETNRSGIRKYLRIALTDIEKLLDGPLR